MRQALMIGTLAALAMAMAGCSSPVPDSGAAAVATQPGVGFGDYASYELERARREAALTGAPGGGYAATAAPFPAPVPVGAAPLAAAPVAVGPSGISATELAAVGIGGTVPPVSSAPLGGAGTVPGYVGAAPMPAAFGAPTPSAVAATAPFPATPAAAPVPTTVAAASTGVGASPLPVSGAAPAWNPEADPLRDHGLEAMPGNAQPMLVTAPVTEAVAATGPNIIEYALSAPNSRGQEWYRRFAFSGEGRMQRNCADYRSPDEAQRDFLARGGPDRDARGIDPDGDGFACGWDPAPFRAAVGR